MEKYIGSQLYKATVFGQWLVKREPCALGIGGQEVQIYILPVTWESEIDKLYGPEARHEDHRRVTVRELRDQETMAKIVMDAVDENWNPASFGVVMLGDAVAAYAVPGVPYWRARVEGEVSE